MTTNKLRCVVDTNLMISAALLEVSISRSAIEHVRRSCTLLVSLETTAELEDVLLRKKFDRYLARNIRQAFVEELLKKAEFVAVREQIKVCRDPKDDKFLELALSGKADYILTGIRICSHSIRFAMCRS